MLHKHAIHSSRSKKILATLPKRRKRGRERNMKPKSTHFPSIFTQSLTLTDTKSRPPIPMTKRPAYQMELPLHTTSEIRDLSSSKNRTETRSSSFRLFRTPSALKLLLNVAQPLALEAIKCGTWFTGWSERSWCNDPFLMTRTSLANRLCAVHSSGPCADECIVFKQFCYPDNIYWQFFLFVFFLLCSRRKKNFRECSLVFGMEGNVTFM